MENFSTDTVGGRQSVIVFVLRYTKYYFSVNNNARFGPPNAVERRRISELTRTRPSGIRVRMDIMNLSILVDLSDDGVKNTFERFYGAEKEKKRTIAAQPVGRGALSTGPFTRRA